MLPVQCKPCNYSNKCSSVWIENVTHTVLQHKMQENTVRGCSISILTQRKIFCIIFSHWSTGLIFFCSTPDTSCTWIFIFYSGTCKFQEHKCNANYVFGAVRCVLHIYMYVFMFIKLHAHLVLDFFLIVRSFTYLYVRFHVH